MMTLLPPGINAILLLIFVSVLAGVMGSRQNGFQWFLRHSSASERALFTLTIAFPFWFWAMYKVVFTGDDDYGAISFLIVILSCAFVYWKKTPLSSNMLLPSNLVVSANYLLPFFNGADLPSTFYIYLGIGCLYWISMAAWNWDSRFQDSKVGDELRNSLV
mmetsp:Transcript_65637/g.77150  ORF Transcript_65637/g.77150 Transcript_65637/m.77150 type:complete len:161 (+) Transcript_65637:117-599(+)